ncbi:M20/M25/M40 family metallo-hydrolase [Patescibacteria group bacterium]|nr:M20/M25/M40 family metallo-hydrolase [Patescibacteria group bacterium]
MNETIKLLKQLIKINSPSGKETKLANFIYNWLKNQKIKPIKQNGNVLVHIKGDSQHKAIIFNGHMDTVSPGDLKKWQYEPFNPTIVKDKLYGLGTSDMKGAVASMMFLAKNLIKNKPICDVWFSFVTKEELDGSGTKNFLKWFKQKGFLNQYQLISAVIGEATGLKKIELGHKGNAFVHVTITGQTGHGSQPEKIKRHAILQMNELITKLNQKIPYWQKKYKDKFLGIPTVGLTGIKAGLFK